MVHKISTAEDLKKIGTEWPLNDAYDLESDIIIDSDTWTCIGNFDTPFVGMFEGAGYSIIFEGDISFVQTSDLENEFDGYGFFGNTGGAAKIWNLTLVFNGNIANSQNNNVGTLVGVMNNGTEVNFNPSYILNCSVKGNGSAIYGKNNVGGFVGTVFDGAIDSSSSDIIVFANEQNAGGFIGYIDTGNISNCSAIGASQSNNSQNKFIGGLNENNSYTDYNNSYNVVNYPEYPQTEEIVCYEYNLRPLVFALILLIVIIIIGAVWYFKNRKT
ncbi:GLUG motif-containing protein [Methanimicrococcus hongohii]|uniref:GLUG motif-containing protein n=1 Tax=Methanimicrococcus hongohii TaxID=3028295 RepID=UPI00292EAF2E|nr:GLUG motif-containing protein [Methanimicrococcus sp. Hf6]